MEDIVPYKEKIKYDLIYIEVIICSFENFFFEKITP